MDERVFQELAAEAFRAIGDALDAVDADLVDFDSAGDVITLTLRRTHKCVVNTQRAAGQIWLAAHARAWHFSWNPSVGRWLDDKGNGDELLATIARIVESASGVELAFRHRTST
jgi:CyaY protein